MVARTWWSAVLCSALWLSACGEDEGSSKGDPGPDMSDAGGSENDAGSGSGPGGSVPTGDPVPLNLVIENGGDGEVWVQTGDCNGAPTWFSLSTAGEPLTLFLGCPCFCDARDADPIDGCPSCAAVCQDDQFSELSPMEAQRYSWDGMVLVNRVGDGCVDQVPLAAGTAIVVEFCWAATLGGSTTCDTASALHGDGSELRFTIP